MITFTLNSLVTVQDVIIHRCHIRISWPYMVNGGNTYATCSLNSRCHCSMEGKCIIVTGTFVHSYFLLPDLWVCKPCTSHMKHPHYIKYIRIQDLPHTFDASSKHYDPDLTIFTNSFKHIAHHTTNTQCTHQCLMVPTYPWCSDIILHERRHIYVCICTVSVGMHNKGIPQYDNHSYNSTPGC